MTLEETLLQQGVLGVVLGWFMLRMEKIVQANTDALEQIKIQMSKCPIKEA